MLSLMVQGVSWIHLVFPQIKSVIVIYTKFCGILLKQLIHSNHTVLKCLCCLTLGQASQLFDLFAFGFIIGDLALQSAEGILLADEGELVSWEQSRHFVDGVGQISVHVIFQTLTFLGTQNIDILFNNTEKDGNKQQDFQIEFCFIYQTDVLFRGLSNIVLKLVEVLCLICEEHNTFLELKELLDSFLDFSCESLLFLFLLAIRE